MKSALLLSVALAAFAPAAAFAAVSVGSPAPEFTATDIAGQSVKLSDFKGRTVVLEWTNPECPIVRKHYLSGNIPGLQRSAAADGVVWIAINSGHSGAEGDYEPGQVQDWLKSTGATPKFYVRDLDGHLGHLYGAKATPTLFVITASGTLAYAGAIDSIPSSDPADIAHATNYVRAALDSVKAGAAVAVPTSHAYGCAVKY